MSASMSKLQTANAFNLIMIESPCLFARHIKMLHPMGGLPLLRQGEHMSPT